MKKKAHLLLPIVLCCSIGFAQTGIGTTSPNSTLDIRGSLSNNFRSFTASTTAATDHTLAFTGTSAATLTLPDATTITGRVYVVKNASSNASTLTIATTSSQTIDGLSSWSLTQTNKSVTLISNGSNWYAIHESLPGSGSSGSWLLGGNNVGSLQNIGTTSNYALPFITNNTEKMLLSADGNLGIGTSSFNSSNPERLLVDGGTSVTDYMNLIYARGNTNSYVQFNIQNLSNGGQSSTDIVATADNGTESANYVDLGINSSTYNNGASSLLNGVNNAYLYSKGQDFVIGNASTSKSIIFFTGGDAPANEKFRLNSNGVSFKSDVFPSSDNTYLLGKSGARWSAVWSANGTIQTSDIRTKTNIHSLKYGLKEIMQLQPISYQWKTDVSGAPKVGLIAQQVKALIPEVVSGDEKKELLGMNYAELVPVLINAIQQQQRQIEELKQKFDALASKK
jgi:hypothetical protein